MLIKKLTPVTKNGDRGKRMKIKIQCAQRQDTYPPIKHPSTFVEEWVEVGLLGLLELSYQVPVFTAIPINADGITSYVKAVRVVLALWITTR